MRRRTVLGIGVVGGVVLAVLGGGAALVTRNPAWRDGRLSATGRDVFRAIARAVLDGSLPASPDAASKALDSHLERLAVALRGLPPATQSQVDDLVTLIATPPGRRLVAGLRHDWHDAPVDSVQAALQSMRTSSLLPRRQAYHALRDLTLGAYFADAGTWAFLGYPGPVPIATS